MKKYVVFYYCVNIFGVRIGNELSEAIEAVSGYAAKFMLIQRKGLNPNQISRVV